MARIRKILIANRGEIACRIIRTARDLGISSVAVYSEPDADARHVRLADMSVAIGAAAVGESYLRGDKIIAAAVETGADAIHPGYGFLSENADFARAVADAGLIFIGPSPAAIDIMGNKAEAKRRMIAANVPCIPGYQGEEQDDARFVEEAQKIGFPLMVKAAAGGGGRGMRLVEDAKMLAAALKTATSEAENAFGSGELILEKAIIEPRHVEIQVFADSHGSVIHLGERDCSVQRRHQKVIEESPCPVMTPQLREAMGRAAIEAARSIDYCGAGTVEFLLDAKGEFYFLEMNTRLQVEHPVTEEVTGLDLVALQIRVAEGAVLGIEQAQVRLRGHAIEVRLYAEDPARDFLPCTGRVLRFDEAAHIEGIRFDSGVVSGQDISPFYDPMLAKLIAYGDSREIALSRLERALRETVLFGVPTNRDFLLHCVRHADFAAGDFSTRFIGDKLPPDALGAPPLTPEDAAIAGVCFFIRERDAHAARAQMPQDRLLHFTTGATLATPFRLDCGGEEIDLIVRTAREHRFEVEIEGQIYHLRQDTGDGERGLHFTIGARSVLCFAEIIDAVLYVMIDGHNYQCVNLFARDSTTETQSDGRFVMAPMHGRVIEIFVAGGEAVQKGERLVIIEAMKMQHEIIATIDGMVAEVSIVVDQQINANDLMITISAPDEKED